MEVIKAVSSCDLKPAYSNAISLSWINQFLVQEYLGSGFFPGGTGGSLGPECFLSVSFATPAVPVPV